MNRPYLFLSDKIMHYYMLNKPAGYVTARRDESHQVVMDLFPEEWRDVLHPVGRLDIDTVGLLLVTDDGRLDNRIMQPTCHVEKCYRFKAFGDLDEADLVRLGEGIPLYGNGHIACPAKTEIEARCRVADVETLLPPAKRERWMKNPTGSVVMGKLTVTEGKRHQVKLMLHSAGCHVFYLERLSLGELSLDPTLPRGKWRELTREEVELVCPGYFNED